MPFYPEAHSFPSPLLNARACTAPAPGNPVNLSRQEISQLTQIQPHRFHAIVYLALPSTNINAEKQFYAEVFGWSFEDFGPEYSTFHGAGPERRVQRNGRWAQQSAARRHQHERHRRDGVACGAGRRQHHCPDVRVRWREALPRHGPVGQRACRHAAGLSTSSQKERPRLLAALTLQIVDGTRIGVNLVLLNAGSGYCLV